MNETIKRMYYANFSKDKYKWLGNIKGAYGSAVKEESLRKKYPNDPGTKAFLFIERYKTF